MPKKTKQTNVKRKPSKQQLAFVQALVDPETNDIKSAAIKKGCSEQLTSS
ncbi:MAG: hypothetical protein U1F57_09225 [bacterium]